jgi:hypothetical protein
VDQGVSESRDESKAGSGKKKRDIKQGEKEQEKEQKSAEKAKPSASSRKTSVDVSSVSRDLRSNTVAQRKGSTDSTVRKTNLL